MLELAQRAADGCYYTYSDFLTLAEQDILQSLRLPTAVTLAGGFDGAERRIAVFGNEEEFGYPPEPPLVFIKAKPLSEKFADELSHRDYLGSILGLGLERKVTGDIWRNGHTAYIACLDSIADFIAANLVRVRHTDVKCTVMSDAPQTALQKPEETTVFAASERADAVCAAVFGLSRSESATLFSRRLVFSNAKLIERPDSRLESGARISVRGYGKFVYLGISKTTRRGRLCLKIAKYK